MEGGLAPGGAGCGCGRNFPVCGMLERIHDGPNNHPEPETPTPTGSNRQFYGIAAHRMGSSDGIQRNCGYPRSDFVCGRATWYRQWDDVWLHPLTYFAQPNSLRFENWRIAHAFGIDRPDAQRNWICRISRSRAWLVRSSRADDRKRHQARHRDQYVPWDAAVCQRALGPGAASIPLTRRRRVDSSLLS